MKLFSVLACFFFILQLTQAGELARSNSAKRDPGVSWEVARDRSVNHSIDKNLEEDSPEGMAKTYPQIDINSIPEWDNFFEVFHFFKSSRDTRFLQGKGHLPSLKRRPSWMYPDDGCYARAAIVSTLAQKWQQTPVAKIFIFGDLSISTPWSPTGEVSWWYHVAPVVRVGSNIFVLDAALNSENPMTFKGWVEKMTKQSDRKHGNIKIAICNQYSYAPSGGCLSAKPGTDYEKYKDQTNFLDLEYERLIELNKNAQELLQADSF